MPDERSDPELHDIEKSVQMHSKSYTKSCKKHSTTFDSTFEDLQYEKHF